ncbi:probable G-protein coupled receptor B0563.6 [Lineus longissimus]|uniref:probable G-protein coupled receptor B0563.6 n=1 Tax=Lineus longissimus TaxID=88925 RepID=UPI00315D18D4
MATHNGSTEFYVEMVGYVYVMPVICSVGVILNLFNLFVLTRKQFTGASYLLMSALAMADFCTLLFTAPIGMSRCGDCMLDNAAYFRMFYEVYFYGTITNITECVSVWITLALSAERYIAMQYHALAKTKGTTQNAKIIIAIFVICSFWLNFPYFFIYYITDEPKMVRTEFTYSLNYTIFSWIRATLVQFAPLFLLTILNGMLIHSVRMSDIRRRQMVFQNTRENKRIRAQAKLTIMLISVIFLFLIGNIPVAFAYQGIYGAINPNFTNQSYKTFRVATHCLSMLSYALNFVLYCSLNRHFLRTFIGIFHCKQAKRTVFPQIGNSESLSVINGHNNVNHDEKIDSKIFNSNMNLVDLRN